MTLDDIDWERMPRGTLRLGYVAHEIGTIQRPRARYPACRAPSRGYARSVGIVIHPGAVLEPHLAETVALRAASRHRTVCHP
jgi:hypothetical protein